MSSEFHADKHGDSSTRLATLHEQATKVCVRRTTRQPGSPLSTCSRVPLFFAGPRGRVGGRTDASQAPQAPEWWRAWARLWSRPWAGGAERGARAAREACSGVDGCGGLPSRCGSRLVYFLCLTDSVSQPGVWRFFLLLCVMWSESDLSLRRATGDKRDDVVAQSVRRGRRRHQLAGPQETSSPSRAGAQRRRCWRRGTAAPLDGRAAHSTRAIARPQPCCWPARPGEGPGQRADTWRGTRKRPRTRTWAQQ